MASKLHSDVAAYSSYIGLVSTGIVYPQQEDPDVKIDQYSYFNIIGTIPPPNHHGIWGCLHYLLLVSNVFLARYDPGTFLSHLTDGGYGFNTVGLPGIDMYQMYVVAPMVKGSMHDIRVGLVYKPYSLFAGNVKKCATFLRTFFNRSHISLLPWHQGKVTCLHSPGVQGLQQHQADVEDSLFLIPRMGYGNGFR